MTNPSCPFCAIIIGRSGRGKSTAITMPWRFPLQPATLGHTLVVPRRRIPDIWGLPEADAACLSRAVLRIAAALRAAVAPGGLNIIQSSGAAATQTVPHLHVHLVPRWAADAMGPIWPARPPSHPPQALDDLRDKLAGLI